MTAKFPRDGAYARRVAGWRRRSHRRVGLCAATLRLCAASARLGCPPRGAITAAQSARAASDGL